MDSVVFEDVSIYETKLNGEKIPEYRNKFDTRINLVLNYDPQGFAVKFLVGKWIFSTKSIVFAALVHLNVPRYDRFANE